MNQGSPVYLDHAATTPVAPEVRDGMLPFLADTFGNPSSIHRLGRAARDGVDEARDRLATVLGCHHGEIVFTAGGTEADNLALRGVLDRWSSERGRHLVVTAVEHDAVLATARALEVAGRAEVTMVGCDGAGRIDPEEVAAAVREDTILVSAMLVNNETGTVSDVTGIARLVRERNPRTAVHSDAVQGLGRLPVKVDDLGVDLLSLSAHKVYGPKGAGALYVRRGTLLAAQLTGGGQERNRRSGTENVPGIAGFGTAAVLVEGRRPTEAPRLARLAARLAELVGTGVPEAVVTGDPAARAPGFATFAIPAVRSDVLLARLDAAGVCASGGSACSSGAPTPSHVLAAMGLPAEAVAGALRCTLGYSTTEEDVEAAASEIVRAVGEVRHGSQGSAEGVGL